MYYPFFLFFNLIKLKNITVVLIKMKTVSYLLKLVDNKYYVGRTINLEQRMIQHFSGEGAKWTKKYYPIEILEVNDFLHKWQESFETLVTMKKYGIENVRGGPWCQINLTFQPKLHLIDENKSIQWNYNSYISKRKK
jgi:predicted GIY-YIG superfamily endonuclease